MKILGLSTEPKGIFFLLISVIILLAMFKLFCIATDKIRVVQVQEKKNMSKFNIVLNSLLGVTSMFIIFITALILVIGIFPNRLYNIQERTIEEQETYNINISKEAIMINGGIVSKTDYNYVVPLITTNNEIKLEEFPKERTKIEMTKDNSVIKSIKTEKVYTLREDLNLLEKISAILFTPFYDSEFKKVEEVTEPSGENFIIYLNKKEIEY